jgi:hypothetical protein
MGWLRRLEDIASVEGHHGETTPWSRWQGPWSGIIT